MSPGGSTYLLDQPSTTPRCDICGCFTTRCRVAFFKRGKVTLVGLCCEHKFQPRPIYSVAMSIP